jgi:hypothetical protein
MDPGQRRLVAHRLLAALRRLHRREPMRPDFRTDAVLAELRADAGERLPSGHRGGGSLSGLAEADLIRVLDALVEEGEVARSGHRIRLSQHEPGLRDAEMRDRIERVMAELRMAGSRPPRVEVVARRAGLPMGVVDQLRASGQLVPLGEGIDYPFDVLAELIACLNDLAESGRLTIARVRDELQTTRRHASALLRYQAGVADATPSPRADS